jgi:hypothetical protein
VLTGVLAILGGERVLTWCFCWDFRGNYFWREGKATANAEDAKDAKGRGGVRHLVVAMKLS